MKIRHGSPTHQILKAIRFILEEVKGIAYDFSPSFNAFVSRKGLDEVLSAMPGYKSNQINFKQNLSVSFGKLKKKGYIKFSDKDNFIITDSGKGILVKFDIDEITLPGFDPAKWDNIWRVLIFDIPELTRATRNLFRNKIQELEFYTLQKSVYATPIACEKEIAELARLLNITNGVDIIHASRLGRREASARKFFGII